MGIIVVRAGVIGLAGLVLTSCIGGRAADWPQELPPRQIFIEAFHSDVSNQSLQTQAAYLSWIRSFYTGTLIYPTGWLDIQRQLLARSSPEQRQDLQDKLAELGVAIGSEWAKENRNRLIDNRMLALWGSILQLAEAEGKQAESVELIAADVDRLYQGDLGKQAIVESRYTDRLELESFDGFLTD